MFILRCRVGEQGLNPYFFILARIIPQDFLYQSVKTEYKNVLVNTIELKLNRDNTKLPHN